MAIQKTVLAVALLLMLLALTVDADSRTRETVVGTGPYDYNPQSTVHYYLLWFPPHAVPMNLTLLNVTWWKPEAIWFVGKYPVYVCGGWCGYKPATIYVVQDGVYVRKDVRTASYHIVAGFVEWHIKNRFCAQGIAMVAPNKIIELSPTTQIWISDVYCLYGNQWYWLRLLPYILREELAGELEVVNASIDVKIPSDYPWPLVPAGWYLDPITKRVFRVPNDTAVMAELQSARMRVSELEAELANKTARLAQLNATLIQLNATIAQLNVALAEARNAPARLAAENQRLRAQLEELNYTRIRLEGEVEAYRFQLEALRAQLAQLTAENQALKAQIASMNETLAKLNEAYTSQTAQLRHQLETWTRAAWIGAALGAAAGAAATTLALRRRK